MEDNLEEATNLKLVLVAFEKLSGLKINFHKSELFCFGAAKDQGKEYVELFGCVEGSFPFRYLGIPMHYRKLSNKHWSSIEERFQKKLSSWKGKLLSSGGRLVLINSVLSSLPMFMMSFFVIPKGVRKRLDYYRSRFFWQCDEHKKKYRLAKWSILCKPRCMGDSGYYIWKFRTSVYLVNDCSNFLMKMAYGRRYLKRNTSKINACLI